VGRWEPQGGGGERHVYGQSGAIYVSVFFRGGQFRGEGLHCHFSCPPEGFGEKNRGSGGGTPLVAGKPPLQAVRPVFGYHCGLVIGRDSGAGGGETRHFLGRFGIVGFHTLGSFGTPGN